MCNCEQCNELNKLYEKLSSRCLCFHIDDVYFWSGQRQFQRVDIDVFRHSECHVLLKLSVLRLLFEVIKTSGDRVCSNVNVFAQHVRKSEFGRQFFCFRFFETNNSFIAYAARKSFSLFVSYVVAEVHVLGLVQNLIEKIAVHDDISKLPVFIETLNDILENGLTDKNVMHEVCNPDCHNMDFKSDSNAVVASKAVIQVLGNGFWTAIVAKLHVLDDACRTCFMILCQRLLRAVKKHDSFDLIKEFITVEVMSLFQTGSATPTSLTTQAEILTEIFVDEAQKNSTWRQELAQNWLRYSLKQSTDVNSDVLLRKIILSVLQAFDSEAAGGAIPWMQKLTEINLVELFLDQDDQLIQVLLAVLNLHLNIDYLKTSLNPHSVFLQFLAAISFDHQVIIDFLISTETQFLLFFTKYLKLIACEWQEFVNQASSQSGSSLETAMTALIQTRLALERLHGKGLFPYNVVPLIKLLESCENLYESIDSD